jgi:osmotically-inducible protein OsmY
MPALEELLHHIRGALESDPRAGFHRSPFEVRCEADGTVILEGEAENIAAKKVALELTASVPGCTGIIDRLRVKPSTRMGDGAIRDAVRDSLLEEQALDLCTLRVRDGTAVKLIRESSGNRGDYLEIAVGDGIVTLNGQVESLSHKRLAGLLAWWVPGTRDVINGIEVKPPEDDSDDEITDAVEAALEKDHLIESSSIGITSRNAVVTLDGSVANQRQAEMAEADAWYIFGVDGVVSQLKIRA